MSILRELQRSEYCALKQKLEFDLPTSFPIFQILNVEITYSLEAAITPRKIYVPKEENNSEFVFSTQLATNPEVQAFHAYWKDTVSKEKVLQYLLSVPNFDWNKGFRMSMEIIEMGRVIDELLEEKMLRNIDMKIVFETKCHMYAIPDNEGILEPNLPPGYRYGKLHPHHVPFVFKNWPYSNFENADEFGKFFALLPSSAVFIETDDDSKDPVSHATLYHYGLIGLTFTVPEHRRKGLAKVVTLKLSSELRKNNLKPVIASEFFNKNSHAMHESIGFQHQTKVVWKEYNPK